MSNDTANTGIIIYEGEGGQLNIEVHVEGETVWLTQDQMAELFGKGRSTITEHILNIFKEGELDEKVVCREFRRTTEHGAITGKTQEVSVKQYNLDVIISVGYRIKSLQGTRFRQWATARLKEYMIKGFVMDDERLKNLGGGGYWKELLSRIRDIRSSEKVLYRQVLDLYATSLDYNPKAPESVKFFKIIQNKLHYAAHGHTAAEVIAERADAGKPFMGLLSFSGRDLTKKDISIAKNYLNEKELKILNNLVSGYFDLAEIKVLKHEPMYMRDHIKHLDAILTSTGDGLLQDAGKISHEKALERAEAEYKKYQQKTLSSVEKAYLDSMKGLEKTVAKHMKSKPTKAKRAASDGIVLDIETTNQ